jgi:iron-sulfur cluster assembly protein
MLTLTDTASTVVKTIAAQTPGAENGGLRINGDTPETTNFSVALAAEPEAGDQVVEHDGAKVFLEENASQALDDKVLDAQVDEGGAVRFAIGQQA